MTLKLISQGDDGLIERIWKLDSKIVVDSTTGEQGIDWECTGGGGHKDG
jgi:hypothetical protein